MKQSWLVVPHTFHYSFAHIVAEVSLNVWQSLPNIRTFRYSALMTTMNVSLPEELKSFVDQQVGERSYRTSSEYIRDLIRMDKDRQQLKGLLLEGAGSDQGPPADASYFDGLRRRIAGTNR